MAKKEEKTLTIPCTFLLTLEEIGKLHRAADKFTNLAHQGNRTDVVRNLIKKLK